MSLQYYIIRQYSICYGTTCYVIKKYTTFTISYDTHNVNVRRCYMSKR